ncbi:MULTISPECIES: IS3 family transposase [Bacillus cereus group]|uniref:IS3 family transposase n=1 Tax=Bacillus cereus group TaxID=86661 RepID=UPI0037BFD471
MLLSAYFSTEKIKHHLFKTKKARCVYKDVPCLFCFLFFYNILTTFKLAVHKYRHFYNHQRFQKKANNLSPYKYRTQVA